MNANPKLKNIDVNIITKKIDVNSLAPWNPKDDTRTAHCTVHPTEKTSSTSCYLPEGNFFRYISIRMQNKIAIIAYHSAQLKKSKIVQRYALDCHHAIPF